MTSGGQVFKLFSSRSKSFQKILFRGMGKTKGLLLCVLDLKCLGILKSLRHIWNRDENHNFELRFLKDPQTFHALTNLQIFSFAHAVIRKIHSTRLSQKGPKDTRPSFMVKVAMKLNATECLPYWFYAKLSIGWRGSLWPDPSLLWLPFDVFLACLYT